MTFTISHVPGPTLVDADALSQSPLDSVVDYDEDAEWKTYSFATETTADAARSYKVMVWGYGIGCDIMATSGTPFKVVRGCETDMPLHELFKDRTGHDSFGSVEELGQLLAGGLTLPHIDVLASTLTCSSRCRFTEKGGNMFLDQLDVVNTVNSTIVYAEMAPPDPAHNDPGEYTQLEVGLTRIGFK